MERGRAAVEMVRDGGARSSVAGHRIVWLVLMLPWCQQRA